MKPATTFDVFVRLAHGEIDVDQADRELADLRRRQSVRSYVRQLMRRFCEREA